MLGWRVAVSAVAIPALVLVFWLDARSGTAAWPLLGLTLLLAARAVWELTDLLTTRQMAPDRRAVLPLTLFVVAAGWFHHMPGFATGASPNETALGPVALAFTVALIVLLTWRAWQYTAPGGNIETLGAELFIVAYVGLFLAVTAQLRWVAGAEAGYVVLGSLIIAVKCGDIGAYAAGRAFGRKKMAPHLSPGKTWMGAAGALAASTLASVAWLRWAPAALVPDGHPCPVPASAAYGLVLGVAGIVGDLAESLIKRDVGRKDAAALLPGFGGVLDLLDSVLFAGPVAYGFWLSGALASG